MTDGFNRCPVARVNEHVHPLRSHSIAVPALCNQSIMSDSKSTKDTTNPEEDDEPDDW